jgi:cobalamin synthase
MLWRGSRDLGTAIRCLTWGAVCGGAEREALARATLYFPLVGGMMGVVLIPVSRLAGGVAGRAGHAAFAVAVLAFVSRGRWYAAVADALREAGTRPNRPPKRPRSGLAVAGALAAVKGIGLAAAGGLVDVALLLALVLGRWAPVVLLHGARPIRARPDDRLAVGRVGAAEFAVASVTAIAIALAAAEAVGLVAVVGAALVTTALRLCAYRSAGCMTAAFAGASIEIVETATVLSVAAIAALAATGGG